MNEYEGFLDEVVKLWTPNIATNGRYLHAKVAGQDVYAEVVNEGLALALKTFRPAMPHWIIKAAGVGSPTLRLMATITPRYMQMNLWRDSMTAVFTTTMAAVKSPLYTAKGIVALAKTQFFGTEDAAVRAFKLGGGDQSSFSTAIQVGHASGRANVGGLEEYLSDVAMRRLKSLRQGWALQRRPLRTIFDFLLTLRAIGENAPRVGAVMQRQKAMTPGERESAAGVQELGWTGRWITQDFAVLGSAMREIGRFKPFMASQVGGSYRLWREFVDVKEPLPGEKGVSLKRRLRPLARLLSTSVALQVVLWMANRDDDEYLTLSEQEREMNHHIPTTWFDPEYRQRGGQAYWKLPVIHEWELLGKVVVAGLDHLSEEDPQAYKRLPFVGDQPMSQDVLSGLADLVLPHWLSIMAEQSMNYDLFRKQPIVPQFAPTAPELQSGEHTSELAQLLGKHLEWSPLKIDHALSGFFASGGRLVTRGIDETLRSSGSKPARPDQALPMRELGPGAWMVTAAPGTHDLALMYNRLDELTMAAERVEGHYALGDEERAQSYFDAESGLRIVDGRATSAELVGLRRAQRLMQQYSKATREHIYADTEHDGAAKRAALNLMTLNMVNMARTVRGRAMLDDTAALTRAWTKAWRDGRIPESQE